MHLNTVQLSSSAIINIIVHNPVFCKWSLLNIRGRGVPVFRV